jgi:MFS superfamily sulfate permease-like transporter
MNLVGCWFGAMPVCHGSGGLAAQYRFGARSGASIIFLGVLKLLVGLLFGESLVGLLNKFPLAFLTVMIVAAGLELASVGESLNTPRARDVRKESADQNGTEVELTGEEMKQRWMVMLVTAGLLVAFKNDAVGFIAGICCHCSYQLPRYIRSLQLQGQVSPSQNASAAEEPAERRPLLPQ